MGRQKWVENRNFWLKSGACALLGISVAGGVLLKQREEKIEEDLKVIAKDLLKEQLKEFKNQYGYQEFDCRFILNEVEILDKKKNEWLVKLNYDVIVINELEKMYSTQTWMMRVRKVNLKNYEVIEQGEQLNTI